jgi:hypothetical protein
MFVYKISICNECYIGSTNSIDNRYRQHENNCINPESEKHNLPIYKFIRENGGWENIKFEVLERITYTGFLTLEKQKEIEQKFYEKFKPKLSKVEAYVGLSKYEYDKQRKQKLKEKRQVKVPCPECNKLMTKVWIKKHIKKIHNDKYYLYENKTWDVGLKDL